MRWGTLERVPQTPQNFSKTGLRLPGIGTDARFRDFSCSLPLPCRPDTRGRACPRRALAPQAQPMLLPAQPRGCKGQSPLHKKTKNPPFPGGEGGWGDGGRKASQKQGWQATRKARPPPALAPQAQPMPLLAQPRGCKGRSPLHKKTKNPPFPRGEGGGGGMGATRQAKGKVSQRGGDLFQESPGASLSPPGATAVLPQKRRRRSASDRGSPTAHRSAQCGGKSWR